MHYALWGNLIALLLYRLFGSIAVFVHWPSFLHFFPEQSFNFSIFHLSLSMRKNAVRNSRPLKTLKKGKKGKVSIYIHRYAVTRKGTRAYVILHDKAVWKGRTFSIVVYNLHIPLFYKYKFSGHYHTQLFQTLAEQAHIISFFPPSF